MKIITKTEREKFEEDVKSFESSEFWAPFKENKDQGGYADDYDVIDWLEGFELIDDEKTTFVFFLNFDEHEFSKITFTGKTEKEILLANYLNLNVDDVWYDHAKVFDFVLSPDSMELPISLWLLVYHNVVKNGEMKVETYEDSYVEVEDAESYCVEISKKLAKELRGKSMDGICKFKGDGFNLLQRFVGLDGYEFLDAEYNGVHIKIQDSEYGIYISNTFFIETCDGTETVELDEEDDVELISVPTKFALSPEQRELVKKFEDLVSEMKKSEIGFILDYEADSKVRFVNMHEIESIQSYYRRDEPNEDYTEKVGFDNLFDLKEDIFDAVTYSSDELLYAKPKK